MTKQDLIRKIGKWLQEDILDLDEAFEDEDTPSEVFFLEMGKIDSIAAKFFRNDAGMPEDFNPETGHWKYNSDDLPTEASLDFNLLSKDDLEKLVTITKTIQAKYAARAIKEHRLD